MELLNELYGVLSEQLNLFSDFYKVEEEKYEVIIRDDVLKLDEIVAKEQVLFLKSKGLENKREKLMKDLGFTGKTMQQLVESVDPSEKSRFSELNEKLYNVFRDFKHKNSQCQELAQMRIQRAQYMMNRIKEGSQPATEYKKSENVDEIEIKKNRKNLVSKKI